MRAFPCGNRPTDVDVAALADRQHGVVTRQQLLALGFGRRAIQNRLATARLHRIHYGVYAVGRRDLTPEGYRLAAVLTCGEDAVLSHRHSAAIWDLRPSSQTRSDVTVPFRRQCRPGIRVHHAELHPEDITTLHGIPTTTVARTLLDTAPIIRRADLDRAIENAARRGILDIAAIERCMARNPRHKGVKQLTAALAAYREPPPTRSELERRFFDLIERADLPRPAVNATVAGLEVDFYWPDAGLVVELDGRGYHSSPSAFERDRIRDAQLLKAGLRVLRISYRRLRDDPEGVLADLRALIASAAA